jgi:uncharacterized protein (DUF2147 family)
MKNLLLTISILSLVIFKSLAQDKDDIVGKWMSAHGSGQIEIYKDGDQYSGKLVWLKSPTDEEGKIKTDVHNPSESLRSHPLISLEILKKYNYKGDGEWTEGTIYDPKSGKTYSSKIQLKSSDKLEIRGFMGISLIGKSEVWTRVN